MRKERELLSKASLYLEAYWNDEGADPEATVYRLFMEIDRFLGESAQEPEPVAWMWEDGMEVFFENSGDPDHNWTPLYTTPPDAAKRIVELEGQINGLINCNTDLRLQNEALESRINNGRRMQMNNQDLIDAAIEHIGEADAGYTNTFLAGVNWTLQQLESRINNGVRVYAWLDDGVVRMDDSLNNTKHCTATLILDEQGEE
jgi:hypothetical protein